MGLFSNLSSRKRSQLPAPATSSGAAGMAAPELAEAAVVPPVSSVAQAQAKELVSRVVHELPAFIAVAVLEADTGTILAGQWAGHSGGAVEAAVANAEIVRQTHLALEALHLVATEQLADILITLRHQLHLLRVLPQSGWLLYLAVHAQDTNPALARAVTQLVDE